MSQGSTNPGYPSFRIWFAWYPVRDDDGNWCWWKYVRKQEDGSFRRLPDDVDE